MAAHRSTVGVRVYAKRGGYLTAYQELVGIAFGSAGREFVHCHGDQVEVRVTRNLMTWIVVIAGLLFLLARLGNQAG